METQLTIRTDAAQVLAQDLGWQARMLARPITLAYDAGLADSGLSGTQFALMCQIAASNDDTLGALARQAGFEPGPVWTDPQQLFSLHWLNAPAT